MDGLTASRDREALATAAAVLRRASHLTEAQGVFSSNESADDVATADMHLLLLPCIEADLLAGSPADGAQARHRQASAAAQRYTDFLHQLEQYGLLGGIAQRQYAQEEEARAEDDGEGSSAPCSAPEDRRAAKIERFKEEKRLEGMLQQIEQRRANDTRDADADGEEATPLGGPAGLDEEDERLAWTLRLQSAALHALQARGSVRDEARMLAAFAAHEAASHKGTPQQREARALAAARASDQDAQSRAKVMQGLRNVAGSLAASGGAGQPPPAAVPPDAVLSVSNARDPLAAGLFRPSHALPTMTVEEFGAVEAAEAAAREGAARAAAEADARAAAARTHSQVEYDDAEVEQQRQWDDYKDANPAGWGNSALRPCGR